MSPFQRAIQVYESEPCARTFQEDLNAHLLSGFVFSTPNFFIMGRPVDSKADHRKIINPSVTFLRAHCDCWHVYLFSGDMSRAWGILPWSLPLISMERRNDLRFYPLETIRRLSLRAL